MPERAVQENVATLTSRRAFLVSGAMMAAAGAAYATRPRGAAEASAVKLGPLIPGRIGPWRYVGSDGLVVARPDEEDTGPADGYDQLLTRVYVAPERPAIMFLLAYGAAQGGGLQLHRPETCYPGQGFSLEGFRNLEFRPGRLGVNVRARQFTAVRDERIERLLYWTRIGRQFPRNTFEEYRSILMAAVEGAVADGLLVRLSTIEADQFRADAALAEFMQALIVSTSPVGLRMLVGSTLRA